MQLLRASYNQATMSSYRHLLSLSQSARAYLSQPALSMQHYSAASASVSSYHLNHHLQHQQWQNRHEQQDRSWKMRWTAAAAINTACLAWCLYDVIKPPSTNQPISIH
jgi:hypothetical protein